MTRRRDERLGLGLMVLATLIFSLMNILVKLALQRYRLPFMETVFFRGLFGTLFVVLMMRARGIPVLGPRRGMLALRGSLGFVGLSCYYYAMARLTLADTVILNKASPVFVMVFAYFFLRERLSRWHLVALAVALFGVFNIVQPQLEIVQPLPYGPGASPLPLPERPPNIAGLIAALAGLASAVASALAYIVVKKLSVDHRSPQIVFAFVSFSTVLAVPFLFRRYVPPRGILWLILIGIGASSAVGQVLMTKAFRLGSPTPVAIASYAVVIFSALWGFLIFDELQNPQAIAGSLLLIGSLVTLPFLSGRARAELAPAAADAPEL